MRKGNNGQWVTIAIVPHDGGHVRSLRIHRRWLVRARVAIGLLLTIALWATAGYVSSLNRLDILSNQLDRGSIEYQTLERAFVVSETRYEGLLSEATTILTALQRLNTDTNELRRMLASADSVPAPVPAAKPAADAPVATGQGGPAGRGEVLRIVTSTLRYADDQLRLYDDHVRELRATTVQFIRRRAHTPSIWPTEGWVSSTFGSRRHPVTGEPDYHYGIDIAGLTGTRVHAAADGTVVIAGPRGNYGRTIIVDHGYGTQTVYAHLSRIAVQPGRAVTKGQLIGYMGSTGLSTGPHLHYEVHLGGRPVNPSNYLP